MNDGHVRGFGRRWANHGLQQGRVSSGYLSCALGPAWLSRHVSQQLSMKMFLIAMFCGCLAFTSLSQGLVIFSNTPTTLVSANINGNVAPINGPVGSYYFALLISSSPSGPFAFPGVYATNVATAGGGRFDGGTARVPGWQPGTTMFYLVAGWAANLGTTFQPSWLSGPGYVSPFYFPEVGSGFPGGGPQILPALPFFGGTGT